MVDSDPLLDDLLSSSRPPVSAVTPGIEDELARMSVMYQFAVVNAIIPAVVVELRRQGFDVEADQFSYQTATDCPGAQW